MALSNEQLVLLDNFIYLNDSVSNSTYDSTVKSKVNYLLGLSDKEFETAVTDEQFFYCDDMVNGMTTSINRTSRYNLRQHRTIPQNKRSYAPKSA